ncbi:MAG TPA: hypothetical protein VHZ51_19135 [Ktedonobacteraceae bacterium]|jgi:hypothetical protein|nr:hypothetical protein [Ktedonobacteraceae bacterium]
MLLRQCAWCLCLINGAGERISPAPLPKLYEASHGICGLCGAKWMEQAMMQGTEVGEMQHRDDEIAPESASYRTRSVVDPLAPTVTELIFQLQQGQNPTSKTKRPSIARKKASHTT